MLRSHYDGVHGDFRAAGRVVTTLFSTLSVTESVSKPMSTKKTPQKKTLQAELEDIVAKADKNPGTPSDPLN